MITGMITSLMLVSKSIAKPSPVLLELRMIVTTFIIQKVIDFGQSAGLEI